MESKPSNIIHLDMNAFFASCEQAANPFIQGKPVAVGAAKQYDGAALLAVSYQAKKRGVKNLMRAWEAKQICPELIIVPFDPLKYYNINQQIMGILRDYSPLMEIYSVDEAFLDLTPVLHLHKESIQEIAQEIKDRIRSEVSPVLTSSVGIAPNKLLAKVGSDWQKPDGMTIINWENRFEFLDKLDLQDIWGIGYHAGPKLKKLGITSTRQIREIDDKALRGIVGSYYTRLKLIANGEYYDPVDPGRNNKPHKSMQHAHTLSVATNDREELKTVIRKMSERLARRLRRHGQVARIVYLGLRPEKMKTYGWGSLPKYGGFLPLSFPSNHGKDIYDAACEIFARQDFGDTKIRLVAVGINDLRSVAQLALDIFQNPEIQNLDRAVDEINSIYGQFTVRTGDILHQKAKESELSVHREDMTFHPTSE